VVKIFGRYLNIACQLYLCSGEDDAQFVVSDEIMDNHCTMSQFPQCLLQFFWFAQTFSLDLSIPFFGNAAQGIDKFSQVIVECLAGDLEIVCKLLVAFHFFICKPQFFLLFQFCKLLPQGSNSIADLSVAF